MLFRLIEGKDFFELNPGAEAIPEFSYCTSQQMWAVSLIADVDHDNPLRTQPDRVRREKAAEIAGYQKDTDGKRLNKNGRNLVNGEIPKVEAAIAKYRELQYDEDEATKSAYDQQIAEIREFMALDKISVCTSKSEDGKEEVVDYKKAMELAKEAATLGKGLSDLMKNREDVVAKIKLKKPAVSIITKTAADISEEVPERKEGMSTADLINQKRRKQIDDQD